MSFPSSPSCPSLVGSPADGDVWRPHWPIEPDKSVNLYLGNGRCGGCFDAYGLQHVADDAPAAPRVSHTRLAHAQVWFRGRHGLDELFPLGRLVWSVPPGEPAAYRQHLDLARGRIHTAWTGPGLEYHLDLAASPATLDRDLLALSLAWRSDEQRPALELRPVRAFSTVYSGCLPIRAAVGGDSRRAALEVSCGEGRGLVLVEARGDLVLEPESDRIRFRLARSSGAGQVLLALGPAKRRADLAAGLDRWSGLSAEDLAERTAAAWRERWGPAPAPPAGLAPPHLRLYWRSHYHLLCSQAPEVRCPAPPMGFTGNAWGFHFPQDLSFLHPALLAHGHSDITRAHVEFYRERLDEQLALTRHLYHRPGACWSWEFPIGPRARLFQPEDGGVPNDFQFEVHNAAYPARMAVETAAALADPVWTRAVAWPVVRESARFLAACLHPADDGRHSFLVAPSMGQDEFGGANAPNYLCALFAAEYTLTQASRLARTLGLEGDEIRRWDRLLEDGLAYPRLHRPDLGFYAANESVAFRPGSQKHPVQLNPLWLLPLGRTPDGPTRSAYRMRRIICSTERSGHRHPGLPTGFYDGWTLFAFLLSAATLGDEAGYAHELAEMLPARLVDPEHVTLYESSGFWQPYYTSSMGLFLQAARTMASARRSPG